MCITLDQPHAMEIIVGALRSTAYARREFAMHCEPNIGVLLRASASTMEKMADEIDGQRKEDPARCVIL